MRASAERGAVKRMAAAVSIVESARVVRVVKMDSSSVGDGSEMSTEESCD
jgi:hypothetical protein